MEKYNFAIVHSNGDHQLTADLVCSDTLEIEILKKDMRLMDPKTLFRERRSLPNNKAMRWEINMTKNGDLRYWLVQWLCSRGWEPIYMHDTFGEGDARFYFKRVAK
jgi:hypothetical protein